MRKNVIKTAACFIFLILMLFPHPVKADGLFEMPDYTFHTTQGTDIHVSGAGYKATVLMIGTTTCSNSDYELTEMAKSNWANDPQIQVIFASMSGSKEEVQAVADKCNAGGFTSCYSEGSDISTAMFDLIQKHRAALSGSWPLSTVTPFTALLDGNNMVQEVILDGAKSADDLILRINQFVDTGYTVSDPYYGKIGSLTIGGTEDYLSADKIYEMVNQTRNANGLSSLRFDKALTETAMQRAAEIAVYYNHIRPDGSDCFTIFPEGSTRSAENIAIGYLDAESAMEGWLNSSGHYANIVSENVINIGIGCFIDSNGRHYWVQCFDNRADYTEVTIQNQKVTRTITAQASCINLDTVGSTRTYYLCSSPENIQLTVRNINENYPYGGTDIDPSSFNYVSDTPTVADIDAFGKVTLNGEGTAVITATLKGDVPRSVSWTIENKSHQIAETDAKRWCISCYEIFWEKKEENKIEDVDKTEQPGESKQPEGSGGSNETGDPTCSHSFYQLVTPASLQQAGTVKSKCTKCGYVRSTKSIARIKSVSLKSQTYAYNGKVRHPAAEVTDTNGILLKSGTDYTVSYPQGCKNIGIYIVTIQFKGNYAGTKQAEFSIVPKKAEISKVKAKKKSMLISWKKQSNVSGYEIRYSYKSNFSGAKKINVKSSEVKRTIKKLKSKKRCYVSIRAYKQVMVNGKTRKLYGAWSNKKQAMIG